MDLSLRDVQEDDLPILFEHQRDPVASRMAAFFPRDRDAFMEHWRRILADDTVTKRTILSEGEIAGNIVAFDRDGKREVGYWIGSSHWGRGLATAGLSEFLRIERARPLHATVAVSNVASIRVLEKCGFVEAGRTRGAPGGRGPEVDEILFELRAPAP